MTRGGHAGRAGVERRPASWCCTGLPRGQSDLAPRRTLNPRGSVTGTRADEIKATKTLDARPDRRMGRHLRIFRTRRPLRGSPPLTTSSFRPKISDAPALHKSRSSSTDAMAAQDPAACRPAASATTPAGTANLGDRRLLAQVAPIALADEPTPTSRHGPREWPTFLLIRWPHPRGSNTSRPIRRHDKPLHRASGRSGRVTWSPRKPSGQGPASEEIPAPASSETIALPTQISTRGDALMHRPQPPIRRASRIAGPPARSHLNPAKRLVSSEAWPCAPPGRCPAQCSRFCRAGRC